MIGIQAVEAGVQNLALPSVSGVLTSAAEVSQSPNDPTPTASCVFTPFNSNITGSIYFTQVLILVILSDFSEFSLQIDTLHLQISVWVKNPLSSQVSVGAFLGKVPNKYQTWTNFFEFSFSMETLMMTQYLTQITLRLTQLFIDLDLLDSKLQNQHYVYSATSVTFNNLTQLVGRSLIAKVIVDSTYPLLAKCVVGRSAGLEIMRTHSVTTSSIQFKQIPLVKFKLLLVKLKLPLAKFN